LRVLLACLLAASALIAPTLPGQAATDDECRPSVLRMRTLAARYKGVAADLRQTRADLVQASTEEAGMKAQRRFTMLLRDAREQRSTILTLYRDLVERDCHPFTDDGYRQTANEFERSAADENGLMASRSPIRVAPP
jgi:hypothetical protein